MATAALKSRGTKLQRETTPGSGTWTSIAEVKDVPFPSQTTERIEVTNQDSPAQSKEFVPGDIDIAEVQFTSNYLYSNATHQTIISDQAAGTVREYRVLVVGSVHAVQFPAYVSSHQRRGPVNGVYEIDFTLQPTAAATEDTTP